MCGIVGAFSREEPVVVEKFRKAVELLHHRGPDAKKVWFSSDQKVGLGHARLSIIDLQTGGQPLVNRDSKLHLVVNGELYGFEEIRKKYQSEGYRFSTSSDSEIVFPLYEEFGIQALSHLRGEFAFLLYDAANRTFFAARDRFGVKPLYYTFYRGTLYCASEIKALLEIGVPAEWDREAFFQSHHFLGAPPADRTFFKHIYQVPAGHYLVATPYHFKILPYWDLDYPKSEELLVASEEELIDAFREKLEDSIRVRLRADVPVGCYLSGGLDSCAVLGIASQMSENPIHAFTLNFDHLDYDEGGIAKEMAQKANAIYHPVMIRSSDLADHFESAVWHGETLVFNSHVVAKYLLSHAVREAGMKVVLTGEGADEILAGYPHFRRDMMLYNSQGQDPQVIQSLLAQLEKTNQISSGILMPHGESYSLESVRKILGFVPSFLQVFASTSLKFRSLFSSSLMSEFSEQDPYLSFVENFPVKTQLSGRDPVNQSLYLWSKLPLQNYILNVLGDRIEMSHSIEGRVPFLDHHLVEFVKQLPISMKIKGLVEKYILREAVEMVITQTVYHRQKHPFLAPPSTFDRKESFYGLLRDIFASSLKDVPFYQASHVYKILEELPGMDVASQTAMDVVLTTIASACVLQKKYKLSN